MLGSQKGRQDTLKRNFVSGHKSIRGRGAGGKSSVICSRVAKVRTKCSALSDEDTTEEPSERMKGGKEEGIKFLGKLQVNFLKELRESDYHSI